MKRKVITKVRTNAPKIRPTALTKHEKEARIIALAEKLNIKLGKEK